jgi:sucrose-6-phosphate hydrolase SacC (GH32 family)
MYKQLVLIVGLLCSLLSCRTGKEGYLFTSFHEPANEGLRLLYSYDGYSWTDFDKTLLAPQVGSKVMRDPSMVQSSDGHFHLVWTTGWKADKGFGYASSKDLIHWSEQKFIPVMQHEDSVVNVWAPEIFNDKANQRFIIVWASTIPHVFPKGVEEEHNNHRLYYTVTTDFKTFSPANLFFDPGFSSIDAVLLRKGNDEYVQVLKDNTRPNRNLKVAFSKDPLGPYTNASEPFTETFVEGPTVVKIKDDWVIYFDMYRKKIYGAMKTRDFSFFTDITNEVSVPPGHKHGTIVPVTRKFINELKKNIE